VGGNASEFVGAFIVVMGVPPQGRSALAVGHAVDSAFWVSLF
jgi:hypothetical protein